MSDHPGLFFRLKKQGDQFICTYIEGELLKAIHYSPDEMIGRPISEILPAHDASMNDYCYLSKKLKEAVTFEMVFQERFLIISIKPSVDEFNEDVILGTAMDMTGVFPRRFNSKQINNAENKNVKIVM